MDGDRLELMKNKTLGWWTVGFLVAYMMFYIDDPSTPIVAITSIGFIGAAIWSSVRLINLKDIDTEAK